MAAKENKAESGDSGWISPKQQMPEVAGRDGTLVLRSARPEARPVFSQTLVPGAKRLHLT